jgi:hypothetical protein
VCHCSYTTIRRFMRDLFDIRISRGVPVYRDVNLGQIQLPTISYGPLDLPRRM